MVFIYSTHILLGVQYKPGLFKAQGFSNKQETHFPFFWGLRSKLGREAINKNIKHQVAINALKN